MTWNFFCSHSQEKAIVIRMTRIVYAFRNKVWPKPMEGLDLFIPTVKFDKEESSSESSEEEEEYDAAMEEELVGSDSDYQVEPSLSSSKRKPRRAKAKFLSSGYGEDVLVDIEGEEEPRDFEIERSHGLKLTLKKSSSQSVKTAEQRADLSVSSTRGAFANLHVLGQLV